MSERTETTWTCTRCEAGLVGARDWQPPGWARLYKAVPPRSGPSGAYMVADLCRDCLDALGWFIDRTPLAKSGGDKGTET